MSSDLQIEKQLSELLTKCTEIVTQQMNSPASNITALRMKLRRNVSSRSSKRKTCKKLKREILRALQTDDSIPQKVGDSVTNTLMAFEEAGIDLIDNVPHSSIILCLKCWSIRSLLRLKQMVLSGLLLRLLSEAIEQFIQSRPRIELVIQAEDYNSYLSYLSNVAGKFIALRHFVNL